MIKSLERLVGRHLPWPLRRVLEPVYRTIYHMIFERDFQVVWDKKLRRDIMEYLKLSEGEVYHMLKLGDRLTQMLWAALNPKTVQEEQRYYEITPFYICDMAYWHMQRRQRKLRDNIVKIASGDVLDYGGGIGDLCARLAEKGLNVTYADVRGKTFEFAKWLFKKRGLEIETIDLTKETLSKQYDTIICIDVIELVSHQEAVLEKMAKCLRENGRLVLNIARVEENVSHPLHQNVQFDVEQLLNSFGLTRTDKDWLWVKPAHKSKSKADQQTKQATWKWLAYCSNQGRDKHA